MIKIGDVCPIFFNPLKYKYSSKGSFRQCFDASDGILLQIFCDSNETPSAFLNNKCTKSESEISFKTYDVNDYVTMYYTYLYPGEGLFSVSVEGVESEEFEVCEGLEQLLVEYSHKDNNSVFDNIFWVGDTQLTFKMRLPGGFKPSGVSMEVDNEQFVNQKQEIVELYSIPYTTRSLIIGDNEGVPYYIAEHINKVLCLSKMLIDGEGYVREGNSKPEKAETLGQKELFLWNVLLRPSENTIAGIGGVTEEAVNASSISFALRTPSDGEVLVYDEGESAFVNTNTLSSL